MNLDGTRQLLFYADDVNVLEGDAHTIKKNTKALIFVSEENEKEVNAGQANYMVMTRFENAGRSRNIKIDFFLFPLKGWKLANIWEQP